MSQLDLVHEAGLEAVSPLSHLQAAELVVGHSAHVEGLLVDCPGHFGLHMIACVIVHMSVHEHGLVGGAESLGGGPFCPESPGPRGVGLLNPRPCFPHSMQSLLSQQEHPALRRRQHSALFPYSLALFLQGVKGSLHKNPEP